MSKSVHTSCTVCLEEKKSRFREFSPHAWLALVSWGEIESGVVGQAMCNGCYTEFRDILIERTEEVASLAAQSTSTSAFEALRSMSSFLENGASNSQIAS